MVKVILGLKGSGKTKKIIDLVQDAAARERGNVVCIEKGYELTYDIPHSVRLVRVPDYAFGTYEFLKGFISGMHAGNYDITQIFIDGLTKAVSEPLDWRLEEFLDWCEKFSEREKVKFTMAITLDEGAASEGIKKYL